MLTRLPGQRIWVEQNDVTLEVTGIHDKSQIIADIQAIRNTLLGYPVATQTATDVSAILNWIANNNWDQARKDRATAMMNAAYQAYQGSPEILEAANLNARLDALIALRESLV